MSLDRSEGEGRGGWHKVHVWIYSKTIGVWHNSTSQYEPGKEGAFFLRDIFEVFVIHDIFVTPHWKHTITVLYSFSQDWNRRENKRQMIEKEEQASKKGDMSSSRLRTMKIKNK